MKKDYIKVGRITTTHGIRGELKVLACNDEYLNIDNWSCVYLKLNANLLKQYKNDKTLRAQFEGDKLILHINSVKSIKQFIVLGFEEFNDINQVEALRNCELFIKFEDAVPLNEGQYYIDDLIGLNVIDEDGRALGELTGVIETGANDVYEVTSKEYGEILIPAIDDCILDVDIDDGWIKVHLLKGLLDD